MSAIQQMLLASGGPIRGQVAYTTAGTFTWVCPNGVTSVCVVAVGPGRSGTGTTARNGGAGGGLGYKNNITVIPGNSYTVVVGAVDSTTDSYFINTATVKGGAATSVGIGGTFTGDGGGNGGSKGFGASTSDGPYTYYYGGGGGASGGYGGSGGGGANGSTSGTQNIGSTGPGGTKGGNGGFGGTTRAGGGGGGANLDGTVNLNGSAGGTTNGGSGSTYGGGGGGGHYMSGPDTINGNNAFGKGGAVRIIWGEGRSFPSNAGDV